MDNQQLNHDMKNKMRISEFELITKTVVKMGQALPVYEKITNEQPPLAIYSHWLESRLQQSWE